MEAGLGDAQPAGQYLHGDLAAKDEAGAEGPLRSWLPWPLGAAAGAASAQASGFVPALPNGAGPSAQPQANGGSHAPHFMPYVNGGYANGFGGGGMGGAGAHAAAQEVAPGEAGAVRRSAREPKSRIILVGAASHVVQCDANVPAGAGDSQCACKPTASLAWQESTPSSILQDWLQCRARLGSDRGVHARLTAMPCTCRRSTASPA